MLPAQIVFISEEAFAAYRQTSLLPRDGAFVRDCSIPRSISLSDLRVHLTSMLADMEAYRAAVRRLKPRLGLLQGMYAELPDTRGGQQQQQQRQRRLSCLINGDSIVQDSELRMRPTENVSAARERDTSWVSNLPPDAVEVVLAA